MKLRKVNLRNLRERAGSIVLLMFSLVVLCALTATLLAASKTDVVKLATIDCHASAVARSRCIIAVLLEDVGKTYDGGGGGISLIKQDATWAYTVSISHEERIDLITYTVTM